MREEMPVNCFKCGEESTWIYQDEVQGIVFGYNFCYSCDTVVNQPKEEPEHIEL